MDWADRIGRRLKLRDLHILLAVIQQGSMGRAAAQLSVSQPVISKAIADMEHVLGVRLLDRTAHGAEPTLYGNALLKWAVIVFDDLRQSVKEIEFLSDPTAGQLRVGTTEAMSGGLLPAIIERLSRRHPAIAFEVIQTPATVAQYQELRDRKVELILGRMPARKIDDDVEVDVLFDEEVCVVAGLRSTWRRRRRIGLADLMAEPWCMPPLDTIQGLLIANAFQAQGLELPATRVSTISLQLHTSLLSTGRYLATLPSSVLRFSGKKIPARILPVEFRPQPWPVAVATLKKRTVSPVAQLFIACARELTEKLRSGEKLNRTRARASAS